VYSATKHAVVGLSHALRGELSGTGVKVCVVYPSSTRTEFFEHSEAPIGPVYSPEWVARLIVRTARFPRRDAMVIPYRFVHITEPIFGGLVDHILGELRRLSYPRLSGTGLPPRRP
jgi:short-subunit dehydrogenase